MNGLTDWLIEHFLAGWLTKVFGKNSAAVATGLGLAAVALGSLGAAMKTSPYSQYSAYVIGAAALLGAIAGLMGHPVTNKPTGGTQ